ncbi:glycosyltransferase family 2 protein [Wenyingzhuangia sp. IMCC45533]
MKLENPRFSVIITLYNKENYIKETVLSVCNQDFKDFEVIIINDGSTDNSTNEVSTIKDDRITLFNIENKGVSYARNYGASKACSEYLVFLDGDDLWKKNHLSSIDTSIKKFPKLSIYTTKSHLLSKGKTKLKDYSVDDKEILKVDYFESSLKSSILHSSSLAVKKEVFLKEGGFDTKYSNYEDIEFWFRLGLKYKIALNSLNTVFIKVVDNSLSRKKIDLKKCYLFEDYDSFDSKSSYFNQVLDRNRLSIMLICKEYNNDELYKKLRSKISLNNLPFKDLIKLYMPIYITKRIKI